MTGAELARLAAELGIDVPPDVRARADEVYASASALYVANQHWWWWPREGQQNWTYLHKFDITNPTRAVYLASGAVEGRIVEDDEVKAALAAD